MRNREIAEIYANSDNEARTQNLFIEGLSIYSYGHHFKIAHKEHNNTALFNIRGYSNTTGKHKSYTLNALNNAGFNIVFIKNAEATQDNIKAQLNANNNEVRTLLNRNTRNERTTETKNSRINFLKEQNKALISLAVDKGYIIEAL